MTQRNDIIDLHSHWFSPSSIEILGRQAGAPRIATAPDGSRAIHRAGPGSNGLPFALGDHWFDIDARIAHLDASGVAHQMISWPTTLGVDSLANGTDWRPLWAAYNDDLAALVKAHPDRFSAVAALSTHDIAWSVRELERAHANGLIGAVLPVNGFFTSASARSFAPIFEAAQRLGSHIYLHTGYASPNVPGQPPIVEHVDNAAARWVLDNGWHFASAVATLAFGDFLDPYPDVTVQVAMLGGSGLAALVAEQVEIASARSGITDVRARFHRIWLDTGAAGNGPAAVAAAIRVLGADRVVFGSDFAPVPAIPPVIANIQTAVTDDAQAQAVFSGNARALLSRFRIPALAQPALASA